MSNKRKKNRPEYKNLPSDESGILIDETGTSSEIPLNEAKPNKVSRVRSMPTKQKLSPAMKSLTKDGKSKKLIVSAARKKKLINFKDMAISFSRGLKKGLGQLRIINKGN